MSTIDTLVADLEYNTDRKMMVIPEYGRHIQKMVDYAVSLDDKEEQKHAVENILYVMGNLNPHLRDVPDFQHKLWDQLFIMADFNLKVDTPYPITPKEKLSERPERIAYPQSNPKYRFYGNNLKTMIDLAVSWEEGEEKDKLLQATANHMKKCFLNWNKDTVDDAVILKHLEDISKGAIKATDVKEPLASREVLYTQKKAKPQNTKHKKSGKSKYKSNKYRK